MESVRIFLELKVNFYSDADLTEKTDEKTTTLSMSADFDTIKEFLKADFKRRITQYKCKCYLRKSWAYFETKTKTPRIPNAVPHKKRRKAKKR